MVENIGISSLMGGGTLLRDLPPDLTKALMAEGRPQHYPDGATIHERSDAKPGLSIVQSGHVQMGNFTADGRYITTAVMEAGQCFGEFTITAGLPRTHHATAVGDVILIEVSKTAFDRLMASNDRLRQALTAMLAVRLHIALEYIEDLRVLPLAARLAKILLATGGRSLTVTQEDLAQTLGVTRVSANKALKSLEQLGLVERHYREITLTDRESLAKWVADQTQLSPI